MTTIVTIKNSPFVLPKEICKNVHLHKGEKVAIDTLEDGTIQIKPLRESQGCRHLKELLKHPYHMGKMHVKSRADIYNDII